MGKFPRHVSTLHQVLEMQVIVVGAGKLAAEFLESHELDDSFQVETWSGGRSVDIESIVVHAGSGRELAAVMHFCQVTASPLLELSTGSELSVTSNSFPVVVCPNANILMLKFMYMLKASGHLFRGYKVGLVESHQAAKSSVPGTAVNMAQSVGLSAGDIHSVRSPDVQRSRLRIPEDQLPRHAYHQIRIEDEACSLQLESRVYGQSPYAAGISRIVETIRSRDLENRRYSVMELVQNGWL